MEIGKAGNIWEEEKQRVGCWITKVTGSERNRGKNQTTLHNILQEKRGKEPGATENGADTGIMII